MDAYMRSIDELRLIAESRKSMIKLLLWMLLIAVIIIATLGWSIFDNQRNVDKVITNIVDFKVEAVRDSLKMMEIDRDMWVKSYVETWKGIEKYCSDTQCKTISRFEEEGK